MIKKKIVIAGTLALGLGTTSGAFAYYNQYKPLNDIVYAEKNAVNNISNYFEKHFEYEKSWLTPVDKDSKVLMLSHDDKDLDKSLSFFYNAETFNGAVALNNKGQNVLIKDSNNTLYVEKDGEIQTHNLGGDLFENRSIIGFILKPLFDSTTSDLTDDDYKYIFESLSSDSVEKESDNQYILSLTKDQLTSVLSRLKEVYLKDKKDTALIDNLIQSEHIKDLTVKYVLENNGDVIKREISFNGEIFNLNTNVKNNSVQVDFLDSKGNTVKIDSSSKTTGHFETSLDINHNELGVKKNIRLNREQATDAVNGGVVLDGKVHFPYNITRDGNGISGTIGDYNLIGVRRVSFPISTSLKTSERKDSVLEFFENFWIEKGTSLRR